MPTTTTTTNTNTNTNTNTTTTATLPELASVTLASLTEVFPPLASVTLADVKADSGKITLARIVLRAFTAHAISGSAVDLSEKSLKGAFLSTAASQRLAAVKPAPNAWRGLTLDTALDAVSEMAVLISTAIEGVKAPVAKKSELEAAKAYIKKLSPETLAALRREGII